MVDDDDDVVLDGCCMLWVSAADLEVVVVHVADLQGWVVMVVVAFVGMDVSDCEGVVVMLLAAYVVEVAACEGCVAVVECSSNCWGMTPMLHLALVNGCHQVEPGRQGCPKLAWEVGCHMTGVWRLPLQTIHNSQQLP